MHQSQMLRGHVILNTAFCCQFADAESVPYQQLHDSKPNWMGQGPQAIASALQLVHCK